MSEKARPQPDARELKALAESLIREQAAMTLATAEEGRAWAAPVYYVFCRSCFYFFSDPASRHVVEALKSGQASAAIFAPAHTWQGIRGVQMSGAVESVSPGLQAYEAVRSYLKKFSFTREFFGPAQSIDLAAFAKRFRVRLYRFRPEFVYYLDNEIRFGFREKVEL